MSGERASDRWPASPTHGELLPAYLSAPFFDNFKGFVLAVASSAFIGRGSKTDRGSPMPNRTMIKLILLRTLSPKNNSGRKTLAKVVFLKQRPQSRPFKGTGNICLTCYRILREPFHFCSLACKVGKMDIIAYAIVFTVPSVLCVMNVVWFGKILRGLRKTMEKRQ